MSELPIWDEKHDAEMWSKPLTRESMAMVIAGIDMSIRKDETLRSYNRNLQRMHAGKTLCLEGAPDNTTPDIDASLDLLKKIRETLTALPSSYSPDLRDIRTMINGMVKNPAMRIEEVLRDVKAARDEDPPRNAQECAESQVRSTKRMQSAMPLLVQGYASAALAVQERKRDEYDAMIDGHTRQISEIFLDLARDIAQGKSEAQFSMLRNILCTQYICMLPAYESITHPGLKSIMGRAYFGRHDRGARVVAGAVGLCREAIGTALNFPLHMPGGKISVREMEQQLVEYAFKIAGIPPIALPDVAKNGVTV